MNPPAQRPRSRHGQQLQAGSSSVAEGSGSVVVVRPQPRDSDRVPPSRPSLSNLPASLLHRHSKSANAVPLVRVSSPSEDPDAQGSGSRATKILPFMKRTLSYKKAGRGGSQKGMLSTPEEYSAAAALRRRSPVTTTPPPARALNFSTDPPSIAQIAIGLHTSRTPHFGPGHARGLRSDPGSPLAPVYPYPPLSKSASSSSSRLPPPLRSSLKHSTSLRSKSSLSPHASRSASPSVSASTASGPATPTSAFSRLSNASRARFERLLGLGTRGGADSSSSLDVEIPRKSVRFTSILEDDTDRKDAPSTVIIRTSPGSDGSH